MHLEVKQETKVHFLVGTVLLGFLSIFKKSKASSPFEALNSVCLSRCQSVWFPLSRWSGDLRLSLGYPQGVKTSLHLVTWNTSLNLSHCREIRPSLSQASGGTFHLRQKAQIPSDLTIAEGKLHLRCLCKTGSPLHSKTGNQLSSWDDLWFM